jgi:hypothetical protein
VKKIMPRPKGSKNKPKTEKVEETVTEPAKRGAPPPSKPKVEAETRLYGVTIRGVDDQGKSFVGGVEKKWLTEAEAKALGLPWT